MAERVTSTLSASFWAMLRWCARHRLRGGVCTIFYGLWAFIGYRSSWMDYCTLG